MKDLMARHYVATTRLFVAILALAVYLLWC